MVRAIGMTDQRPFVIGITGNIGSGKSTVGRMLTEMGAETIDADQVAHRVMRAGSPVFLPMTTPFSPQLTFHAGPNGSLLGSSPSTSTAYSQ